MEIVLESVKQISFFLIGCPNKSEAYTFLLFIHTCAETLFLKETAEEVKASCQVNPVHCYLFHWHFIRLWARGNEITILWSILILDFCGGKPLLFVETVKTGSLLEG